MRLFWKIFFSVVTVTTAVFCISGHILIYEFFQSGLEQEIETAGQSVRAFGRSLNEAVILRETDGVITDEDLQAGAAAVRIEENEKITEVNLYSRSGEWLKNISKKGKPSGKSVLEAGKEADAAAKQLLKEMEEGKEGYVILKSGESYLLRYMRVQAISEQKAYVEFVGNISEVFRQKDHMYQIYMRCMVALLLVTVVAVGLLTTWIVRPIRRLARAANEFAKGNFSERIPADRRDELGFLAEQFNEMGEKISSSMEELKKAALRQEQFTGSFAHELKTPLTSIIGYAEMLRTRKMSEETRMLYGDHIFRQGKRLEALAGKMMEITALEQSEIEIKEIWLDHFLNEIAEELLPACKKNSVTLTVEAKENMRISADPVLLKSVLFNLIDNSMKAMKGGEEKKALGNIRIKAEEKGNIMEISVIDNGKGIAKEDISRVTESFYMADKSRKRDGSGSVGLGLAICEKILKLHHASMQISSLEGQGTTVVLQFEAER